MKIALVTGGATKIKSYVFESSRLPEIRGASGLLDRINLIDTTSLFGIPRDRKWDNQAICRAEEVRKDFQNRTGHKPIDCPNCVIYANGGELLAFAPASLASDLADEIELIYTRETLVAQSVAVYCTFTLEELRNGLRHEGANGEVALKELFGCSPNPKRSFGNLVARLALDKFRRREANSDQGRKLEYRMIPHFETSPFNRRCSSCERRDAVVSDPVGEDDRAYCEACARKRFFGKWTKSGSPQIIEKWRGKKFTWEPKAARSWIQEFEDVFPDAEVIKPPKDLNEIGQAAEPEGFIGVVYADGNNMSALLEDLKTPIDYRNFAGRVYEATKSAVFEALENNPAKPGKHIFEILSIGGDDFFLIVPAHVALQIACDIASRVEGKLRDHTQFKFDDDYKWERVQRCQQQERDVTQPQSLVSFSAGVVIADSHTPVFYLQELASQLLKTAKQHAKSLKRQHSYCGGTIDFLALKSVTMISGSVEQFRTSALTSNGRRLYARPYTIAEMRAMIESIKHLKRADFPRSQLHRLRESLQQNVFGSTIDYLYFLSRDKETHQARRRIEKLWTLDGQPLSQTTPVRTANGVAIHPNLQHPWRKRQSESSSAKSEVLETIWYDLAELYDFVPGENS